MDSGVGINHEVNQMRMLQTWSQKKEEIGRKNKGTQMSETEDVFLNF
jgi:hypothetical protein